jgi:phospholipid transport system substrate-binding protein
VSDASLRRFLIGVLTALAVALALSPAFAGPPTDRLRQFFGAVDVILADPTTESQPLERVARVKRLVSDIADVRSAAATALGDQWQARTPAERDQFTELFADLLERGYVARIAGMVSAKGAMTMEFVSETRVGEEAIVETFVRARDGRQATVEYRMTERRGRWFVRDVTIDGLSTVGNYRAQFRRLLRDGTYVDLVAHLRAKLAEETLMFAHAEPRAKKTEDVAAAPAPAPIQRAAPVAQRAAPTPRPSAAPSAVVTIAPPAPSAPKSLASTASTAPTAPATKIVNGSSATPQRPPRERVAAATLTPPAPVLPEPTEASMLSAGLIATVTGVLVGLVAAVVGYLRHRRLPWATREQFLAAFMKAAPRRARPPRARYERATR